MSYDVLRAMRTVCSFAQSVRNNQSGSAVWSKNDKQQADKDQNLKTIKTKEENGDLLQSELQAYRVYLNQCL